jgi:N-methylhydantoinase B
MPPFKLYEAGRENALAFEIMGRNCRVPDLLLGDLRAMAGAAKIGAERLCELLVDYGMDDIEALSSEILNRSEAVMRQRIRALPDSVHEYGLDIDGYIKPVHLHAKVEIRDSDIFIDYSGTSPQRNDAAINSVYNSTYAPSVYPFKCALVHEIPNNEGLFRPIHMTVPAGSILNAQFPAAVKARAKTINNMNQVLFGALWSVLGDRVQASNGGIWPLVLMGRDADFGNFLVDMLPHGGRGGMPTLDGMIPVAYPENSTSTPCEIIETKSPVMFEKKEFRPDSAGPGCQRGGVGQIITFKHVGKKAMIFNLTPDRITTLPQGLNGGQAGQIGQVYINGELITRFPPIQLQPGDLVELHLPGGGGFGPVAERSRQSILSDLEMGYITPGVAREDYGWELDDD